MKRIFVWIKNKVATMLGIPTEPIWENAAQKDGHAANRIETPTDANYPKWLIDELDKSYEATAIEAKLQDDFQEQLWERINGLIEKMAEQTGDRNPTMSLEQAMLKDFLVRESDNDMFSTLDKFLAADKNNAKFEEGYFFPNLKDPTIFQAKKIETGDVFDCPACGSISEIKFQLKDMNNEKIYYALLCAYGEHEVVIVTPDWVTKSLSDKMI